MVEEIMQCLETIEYGFKDQNGFNIYKDIERWDRDFEEFYYLLSPEELLERKCGTCWEQVELERKLFSDLNITNTTYFICTYAEDASPCHTFLVYEDNGKYYWFEHSWYDYKGIHEYNSIKELLLDVKNKFIKSYSDIEGMTFVTRYNKPPYHLKCSEMYEYMEHQELLRLNEEDWYYIMGDSDHLCTVEELKDILDIPNENKGYTIGFKDYKVIDKYITYQININDEYLQKKMLDIIEDNNYVFIHFDNSNIFDFLKRCE